MNSVKFNAGIVLLGYVSIAYYQTKTFTELNYLQFQEKV